MNGVENRKAQIMEKPVPGCLGRVVNLFDLGNGTAGNRLLTDKPHREVSPLSRSRSDVAMMSSAPFGDQIEDKMIVSEFKRSSGNIKATGTPMKTLIAREMSKEVESARNPPNLVAKLMGLDALPPQPPGVASQRSLSKGYSRRSLSHSDILVNSWVQDRCFLDKQMQREVHHCEDPGGYKDVVEIQQPSPKINSRDNSPHKGSYYENSTEKKMTLVRQKFMEAKCLATDEKGRQSKEFQDALEVLSSNRDLFLKLLQEPNSLFAQHLHDIQPSTPTHETKCITVLRPSKVAEDENFATLEKKSDRQSKKPAQMTQTTSWNKHNPQSTPTINNRRVDESHAKPTRIVLLKPSPGNTHDIEAVVSLPCSSPRTLRNDDFCDEYDDDEARESREVAREITRQMRDNLMGHRRDETLLSSVLSNGYVGDDSSFNKSDECANYAMGVVSDSEIMSPTSGQSWDYINMFGSPFSSSSFSHASRSPESSVCREAKKRLSERWAMMTSNGISQEQGNARRSSSTLGEMLALSDTKKPVRSEEENSNEKQESRGSTSCLINNLNKEEDMVDPPKCLQRSKSLPASSTVYVAGLDAEFSNLEVGKAEAPNELKRAKSTKSSLKGKFSSLFFSRNKKSSKDKLAVSQSTSESESASTEVPASPVSLVGKMCDDESQCPNSNSSEECSPPIQGSTSKPALLEFIGLGTEQGIISPEGELVTKPPRLGNVNENQDQPSPISVLEDPFKEDDSTPEPSVNIRADHQGSQGLYKSNLIDKSPLIGSIARTLSWEDSCAETSTSYPPLKSSFVPSVVEDEEEDWLSSVQMLLSAAALGSKVLSDLPIVRWYSSESPLDPLLREKFVNINEKDILNEAMRRQRRSHQKLVFDCVNEVLVEITGFGSDRSTVALSHSGQENKVMEGASSSMLEDLVWAQLKALFFSEFRCTCGDGGDMNSLALERVVRNEVVGKGWSDNFRIEFDSIGVEIEGTLLEDLVEEAVVDFTSKV